MINHEQEYLFPYEIPYSLPYELMFNPTIPPTTYLYRDTFSDVLGVGAIDATAADEGGDRNVVDGSNHMTMDGESLILDGGTGVAGAATYWSDTPYPRRIGQVVAWNVTFEDLVGLTAEFGIDVTKAGSPQDRYVVNSTVGVHGGNSQQYIANPLSMFHRYNFYMCQTTTGVQYFLQDGIRYKEPTLLYHKASGTTANTYPNISALTAPWRSQEIMLADNLRYTAKPVFSDSMTLAVGITDGLGHVDATDPIAAGGANRSYEFVGTWQNSAGAKSATALDTGVARALIAAGSRHVITEAELTITGGLAGIVAKYTDELNHITITHDGVNTITVTEVVAGVTNVVDTDTESYSAGAPLRVATDYDTIQGETIRVWYNNSSSEIIDIPINPLLTGVRHGVMTTDTGNSFENIKGTHRGTGGEHNTLKRAIPLMLGKEIIAVGDSKSAVALTDTDDWKNKFRDSLIIPKNTNYHFNHTDFAAGGATAAIMEATVTSTLANYEGDVELIIMNLGVNDSAALPAEGDWKADMRSMINQFRAKYSGVNIYINKVWRRTTVANCVIINGWIDDLVAEYASRVYVGWDETVWLEGGDDGVTMTTDGIHYSVAGNIEAANQLRTVLGLN